MRVFFVLVLLSLPAFADGFAAILSTMAVGGPLAPVFAVVWAHRQTRNRPILSRWCALAYSVPAAVGAFRLSFSLAFERMAGSDLGILCGPLILGSCLLSAVFPGGLLRFAPVIKEQPAELAGRPTSPLSYFAKVAFGILVFASSLTLLYLAIHVEPAAHYSSPIRPSPAPKFVWKDEDLDHTYRVTVDGIALGMSYDEIVRLSGKPTFAWHRLGVGNRLRLFTESEVAKLRNEGLVAFTTVGTVRFNPVSSPGKTHVDFDSDGRAVQIYGRSLELAGRRIATEDSGPPWLPPLQQALPPPDELRMDSHEWRDYYYRKLGLRIDVALKLTFSLHSERDTSR